MKAYILLAIFVAVITAETYNVVGTNFVWTPKVVDIEVGDIVSWTWIVHSK